MVIIKKTFLFLTLCVGLVILSQVDFSDSQNTTTSSEQPTTKADANEMEGLAWLKK